jgi:tetratricopeptide (TPR) repeat protein
MNMRNAIIGGVALLALTAAARLMLWPEPAATPVILSDDDDGPLPIPPVPPRIAEGSDYEKCLGMLSNDPEGARSFADSWHATGGGDGATHCLALATVALGEPERGAEMLEKLAATSTGTAVSRATVYGQADQSWLIAGETAHAFGAATLALSLSPEDPDLLIDRAVAAGLLDRFQDCIDDLTHALDIDSRRPDAYVLRGSAWRHMGQAELAMDDLTRALILDPERSDALLERGILRQSQNNAAGARADWERAIELAPDSATADLAQQNLALLEAGPVRR